MDQKRIQRLQRNWEKEDNDLRDQALAALLAHSNGRKYLWWLLRIGRVGTQPFTDNALRTSFACGELNVGQQVLDHIISVDPAGYVRMMEEQANDRNDRDNQLRELYDNGGDGRDYDNSGSED